jgi:hypothetical protein
MFEDVFDGRWLFEGRGHVSTESGGFFSNIGIERVFSIDAAGADVSLGGWFDYDDDQQGNFSHTFVAWGVSGAIKTRRWDLLGNGYFPEGSINYTQGDPTGENCFFNNSIILQAGIDTALKGFDVTLRSKPPQLAFLNGSVDIGGYGYEADLVDFFGGGRARLNFQFLRGLFFSGEINYDERYDITGSIGLAWFYGVNVRGDEYAGLARDLERTVRNDHIVRFNQELIQAIDPDTGRPYVVWHVDNTADPAFADGSFETRFTSLAEAQAASGADDIIFVHEGDRTARNYTGITLKDRQLLLGDGVRHLLPIQNGLNFVLCNDVDGVRPIITGMNNQSAVRLSNDNTVRGFEIDGSLAAGGMAHGIFGSGFATNTNGVIEDNLITNAIVHGVFVEDLAGDWNFARNTIEQNGFDGIFLLNACDPNSIFNFEDNEVNENGRHGIHMQDYDAVAITFLRNITNMNGGDGVLLEDFKNQSGLGVDIDFIDHEAIANNGAGIRIVNGTGNLRFINSDIQDNLDGGIVIEDWTDSDPSARTLIGISTGGTSTISGNGAGAAAGIDVLQTVGTQTLIISDSTIDNNGTGIRLRTDGLVANLTASIIDNLSISGNTSDGVRAIATAGSRMGVLVDQPNRFTPDPLPMIGNGSNGMSFFVGSASGGNLATVEAIIRNVNIQDSAGDGIFTDVVADGGMALLVEDSTFLRNANALNLNLNTNFNGFVNSIEVRNITSTDHSAGGVLLNTFGGTFTDIQVVNSSFVVNNVVATNTIIGGIVSDGIAINARGNSADPAVDNRVRAFLQGNTIRNHEFNGIELEASGDGHILAVVDGNEITGNGFGVGPRTGGGLAVPFFDGISVVALEAGVVNTRITNNLVTGNFERGLDFFTEPDGTINAVAVGNNFGGNDVGEDLGNGIIDSNISDMRVINNGVLCLAMSDNFFVFDPEFLNNNAAAFFRLELDGNTNGFGFADVMTPFTPGAFGSVCEGLIEAEEAAYLADGFPPQ